MAAETERKGSTGNGREGNSNSTKTTSSESEKGRGTTTNTGIKSNEIFEKSMVESPNFVPINLDGQVSEEVPKPKRKYKTREKKSETKESNTSVKDIQMLIEGVFTVVALKGGDHWNLNSKESEQIAKPLSNILEKNNLLEKVGNVSDGMGLIIAVISIVIPRVLVSKMNKPKDIKEVLKNNGVIKGTNNGNTGEKDNKGNTTESYGNNVGNDTGRIESNNAQYLKSLSPQIYS